jgi:hypothetical protein
MLLCDTTAIVICGLELMRAMHHGFSTMQYHYMRCHFGNAHACATAILRLTLLHVDLGFNNVFLYVSLHAIQTYLRTRMRAGL